MTCNAEAEETGPAVRKRDGADGSAQLGKGLFGWYRGIHMESVGSTAFSGAYCIVTITFTASFGTDSAPFKDTILLFSSSIDV